MIHHYGYGGSGWSLSWGSGYEAMQMALATGERDFAVIGCGAIGLTTAVLLARTGARVTIYAKDLPPFTRSSWATGCSHPTRASHWPSTPRPSSRNPGTSERAIRIGRIKASLGWPINQSST